MKKRGGGGYSYKKYRRGVFCVVYTKKPLLYLLLHRIWHWKGWEFCKGGVKGNEKLETTAIREVKEETGLDVINLKRFPVKGSFIYDPMTQRERKVKGFSYVLFACEVKRGKVKLEKKEHDGYVWAEFKKALKLLTWPERKKCLKIVHEWLKKKK